MTKELDKPTGETANELKRKLPRMTLETRADGALNIELQGDFTRLRGVTGNREISAGIVRQMASLGSQGMRVDEAASNFAVSFVDSMVPQDPAEALLLTQMATTHQAVMMLARHLNHVETIPQKDCAEKALNKTARTFAAQMDTLKRYRSKGQQTVRVERVVVEEGAQAVVGNVQHGGRGDVER